MKLGDTVRIARIGDGREESKIFPRPTQGIVTYIGKRFLTVALCDDDGKFFYRESFWPEQVKRIRT